MKDKFIIAACIAIVIAYGIDIFWKIRGFFKHKRSQ
jgi:hypothetical protein